MTEHVLVVGSGRELPGLVRRAKPAVSTSVICRLEFLAKLRDVTEHARVVAVRHDAPDEEWVRLAAEIHAQQPITRLATFGERDQDRAAAIGAALGVPTHHPRTIRYVHDKEAMRARLREAGVDDTASARVRDAAELRDFVAAYGQSIVKPVRGAGSAGVALLRHEHEAEAAFARAAGRFDGLPDAGVLVEQFHAGVQYSVEAFSEDGCHEVVAVTRKFSDPVTFVELGHVVPADLDAAPEAAIHALVRGVLDALGVGFGATHTEIVLTAAGPRVIETHVRMGGDEIPALVYGASGVDLTDFVVRQTVGERVLPDIRAALAAAPGDRYEAIWYAAAPATGRLEAIHGLDAARATTGVRSVEALVAPGAELRELASSDDRTACARAYGDSAETAVAAARLALGQLEYVVAVREPDRPTV
jgi:biotin carboxylase